MSEGGIRQAKLDRLTKQITEEENKWKELGVHLNMMKFTPEEMFMWKCMQQALVNCFLQGKHDEIDLNIEMKDIVLNSMKEIRENIEPQVKEAKRQAMSPRIVMPWEGSDQN